MICRYGYWAIVIGMELKVKNLKKAGLQEISSRGG
ncbi:MAG: hypothetical protein ACD_74C00019G0001, partial [uncultured bacterium]